MNHTIGRACALVTQLHALKEKEWEEKLQKQKTHYEALQQKNVTEEPAVSYSERTVTALLVEAGLERHLRLVPSFCLAQKAAVVRLP